MNIHEYQAKGLLAKFGVGTLSGHVAYTPDEAVEAAKKLGGSVWVVKAQIHAGGRGKGGGVKVVKSPAEARDVAAKMLGMRLVTYQTGPEGSIVKRVLVEEGLQIARELYLGIVIDRSTQKAVVVASQDGGVEIEKVAHETPERIHKAFVDPALGLQPYQARQLAFALGLTGDQVGKGVKMMMALYQAFVATDSSLLESNPLIVTGAGDLLALDAKINFDDNALFRHADIKELRDLKEEAPLEVEASKYSLNYIKLDG